MYTHCINACSRAYCYPTSCVFNNHCCLNQTLPRSCASCILPRRDKDDEWKCYSRCLSGYYKKNLKDQFESPLWRKAKRARDKAVSMMDLPTEQSLDPSGRVSGKIIPRKIPTSAEIIVEKLQDCQAGRLRSLAKTQNCDSHRMAQLLLQRKLCNKCKCNPYDNLPDVPLTFYPPKKPCYDIYGNACDDEYAKKLLEYVCSDNRPSLNSKQMLNKTFLKSLNQLYADVGGGRDLFVGDMRHSLADREEEFNGFFGEKQSERLRSYKISSPKGYRESLISTGVGSDTVLDDHLTSRRPTNRISRNSQAPFHYPTEISQSKRINIKLDPETIKKYLVGHRRRHKTSANHASIRT